VHLDLRDAVLAAPLVEISAWAVMGSVHVRVPDGVVVEMYGSVVMGASTNTARPSGDDVAGPVLRIRCHGIWGGVHVKSSRRKDKVRELAGQLVDHALPVAEQVVRAVTGRSGTVSILVTDIVGSTALAERLGDQRWVGVLQSHDALVREQLAAHGGTEVKHVGDGFVATFPSARDAVRAALGVQRAMDGYRHGHPESPLEVRTAVHAGEVERVGDDVYGVHVSTAAHLADVAAPGQVLVSGVVRDLAGSTSDLRFGELRLVDLVGRSGPVAVHTVVGA
jgi:class 3 adenylate cyclase